MDYGPWIRGFGPASRSIVRLVCFPHAGASAGYFDALSRELLPLVEVVAIQYPGRQDRRAEPRFHSLTEIAAEIAEPLRDWAGIPFAFFGHSMGATIAFEVALRLEACGVAPLALLVSGRRAPSCHRDETVHLRDDDGLIAEVRRISGTDASRFDEAALRRVLPRIRGDYEAVETYRYQAGPALTAPIHVHVGDLDPKCSLDEARAWREHTSGHFTMTVYPGGHFYLDRHKRQLNESIIDTITAAGASDGRQ